MPNATHAIDPLRAYQEGVRDTTNERPIPLAATAIDVTVEGVFATVRTRRVFRNDEAASIEATMTFPVPVDAVAHDLRVEIDGRTLVGKAEPKVKARATYEAALDAGKAAVLHEEALKGVHVLSIAHIPPGGEVAVEICWSKPLGLHGPAPSLRIPTTVAEIYGRLPLLPADDLIVHETRVFEAALSVRTDAGLAHHRGRVLEAGQAIKVPLDRPIDLAFTGLAPRRLQGVAADGRGVTLAIDGLAAAGDQALRLGILFDRSGSTADAIDGNGAGSHNTWYAALTGLREALAGARAKDSFEVWQFDSIVEHVGAARGKAVARVLGGIQRPRGGTEAGMALQTATACADITDILFITDGRTGAIPVQAFAGCGKRVSAVLCGANSLDAMIGHLCALTGGQVIVAASDNIAAAIAAVVAAARAPAEADAPRALAALPRDLSVVRGATAIRASWSEVAGAAARDAVGAYAAALALPSMTEAAATQVAVAHGLCTHLTSLVVVDEAGEAQEGLPNQRKIPLSRPIEAASAMPRAQQAPYPAAAPAACPPPPAANPVQAPCAPPPAAYPESVAPCAPPPEQAAPRPLAPRPAARAAGRGDRGGSFLRRLWPSPASTAPVAPRPLRHIAADIDWDGEAKALSKGVLAGAGAHDRAAVAAAARLARIIEIAAEAAMKPQALVVALMAASVGSASRGAERIARQGLAGLSGAQIAEAMALLGL